MMTRGDLVFIDTNVLLAATDRSRPDHVSARDFLTAAPGKGVHCAVTGQVMREYLVVATRPIATNGLGLPVDDAVKNARIFRSRLIFLDEDDGVSRKLEDLVQQFGIVGRRIHDANIAAAIVVHGIPHLVTVNKDDFAFLTDARLLSPAEAVSALPV